MSSIRERVIAAARAAVAMLPDNLVDAAEDAIDEVATVWHHTTAGSRDAACEEVHVLLESAKDDLSAVRLVLGQLPVRVESWVAGLGGDADRTSAAPPVKVSVAERARLLEHHRQRLAPGEPGAAPLGWWVDEVGIAYPLKSGRNTAWAAAAKEFTLARGMAPGRATLGLTHHVEIQFAMRMRAHGLSNETIVIDRLPCGVKRPQEKLVEFLPPGATLTVITQGGRRFEYTGVTEE
ncbi:hypothetical protein NLX83_17990 [Allokutzneria sp. A3M-2-11 16]|uniref:DddA-like double-stranded DNA deaminase toxin n=1 Tax=Allokutzneria sp. A3M-2-11 16 TaxID=2962043 RepID=UPI0020B70F10|nr:DddA-like double-stranded DNA deaminase toxin [Allokutzneria sp. A3M-2-11 16]MCP3801155.1 hypothetical protein [Allokutzneria sp. A3M-2-11 16]